MEQNGTRPYIRAHAPFCEVPDNPGKHAYTFFVRGIGQIKAIERQNFIREGGNVAFGSQADVTRLNRDV
jgi:hypothetical protein